ncbi:MAG TPA: outer membrane beta-barrel protein [Vicinamibacterales bacterium]|nr:outer membrane beta-barrel protein [Vicinamibacterales bacterium]
MKIASALVLALLAAAPLRAQDSGAVVGASIGVTDSQSRADLTYAGSAGYRFNRYVGLEIEVTAVPTLKGSSPASDAAAITQITGTSAYSALTGSILAGSTFANPNGRAVMFTNNLRVELPTAADRLTPFFVAGGGVASIRRTGDVILPIPFDPLPLSVGGVISPPIRTITQRLTSSSTDLALTIGGGVAVRVASHATIDADLRLFEFLDATNSNVGRFTVGVRYSF